MVFIPCLVLVKENEHIINLNPSSPKYHKGSVKRLIEKEKIYHFFKVDKEAVLVVRDIGYGAEEDMNYLNDDLAANSFNVKVYGA